MSKYPHRAHERAAKTAGYTPEQLAEMRKRGSWHAMLPLPADPSFEVETAQGTYEGYAENGELHLRRLSRGDILDQRDMTIDEARGLGAALVKVPASGVALGLSAEDSVKLGSALQSIAQTK